MPEEIDITLRPHIIVTGNPGDGFEYRGPFPTFLDAADYADRTDMPESWWISLLQEVQ